MALSLRKSCNPSLHRTSAIGELRKWQSLRAASPASPRRHSVPHLSTKLRTASAASSMPFVVGPPRSGRGDRCSHPQRPHLAATSAERACAANRITCAFIALTTELRVLSICVIPPGAANRGECCLAAAVSDRDIILTVRTSLRLGLRAIRVTLTALTPTPTARICGIGVGSE